MEIFDKIPPRTVVLGLESNTIPDDFEKIVEKFRPFGIIFFARNFDSTDELASLISRLRSIDKELEFLIDQEGGEKCRILKKPYCPPQPWNMRDWKTSDIEKVFFASSEALAELGLTIDLAPVADLGIGKYIKYRTFGTEPESVAECVAAAIRGIFRGGMKPCAKHFPGLGTADFDPHKTLPTSNISPKEFAEKHWLPFRAAIEENCPFIMTTHLLAKSLDKKNPATYSRKTVNILRELGFLGKIFTDDISEMQGAKKYPAEKRIFSALDAGHDIVLWCSGKRSA